MLRKRKIFLSIFVISIIISLFSLAVLAAEIEIKPVLEGQEYYIMKLGETQTFQAFGFGWDAKKNEKKPNEKIKAIQWSFDSRFLELIGKKGEAITLKAIRMRTSKLTVTGKVEGKEVTKTVFIVIKK